MSSNLIKYVTDSSFQQDVLDSSVPVLVDFWAEWCGPCRTIAPILDDAADKAAGKLQIVKINVDESREVPARYGIRGIPTLMIFKDGDLLATKVGALGKPELSSFLQQNIGLTL